MALARLLERRSPEGTWEDPCDLYAFCGSLYIIMLRTTGLIEQQGAAREECLLVRHIVKQVNPDGGFYKFPGSPSCKNVTRVAVVTLRLVLGEVAPDTRPASWYRPNEGIDEDLERQVRATIARAEHFLKHGKPETWRAFRRDHKLLADLVVAYVDHGRALRPAPLLAPELWAAAERWRLLAAAHRQLNRMVRKAMPAVAILYRSALQRSRLWGWPLRLLRRLKTFRRWHESSVQELTRRIRTQQDQCGGWFYSPIHTALNIMGLREAGIPVDASSIVAALDYLRGMVRQTGEGGTFVNAVGSDLWNTSRGVYAYLSVSGHGAMDDEILPSIEFVLRWQGADGGYAYASGCRSDPDSDSTGSVLRGLAAAARTARGPLKLKIDRALQRARTYLMERQNRRGGFSIWDNAFVRCRPGPCALLQQALFDVASADVTARVLEALAELGFTTDDQPVRGALRFLLNTQCRNGAWWARWWAGYIAGTDDVLRAYGKLGLGCGPSPCTDDRLLARSHEAMVKAIAFLVQHQNDDGGWGETIRADRDARYAGVGPSNPVHTAHTLSALLACGHRFDTPVIRSGIEYLLGAMAPGGRWEYNEATFTIFAQALYYPYRLMATGLLPLHALTDYLRASGAEEQVARQGGTPSAVAHER